MKIYTKTGDKGHTSLLGGTRVPKHHIRIDTYGTVDELNSWVGLIGVQQIDLHYKDVLVNIQNNLFTIGAILATDPEKVYLKSGKKRFDIPKIKENDIALLEKEIDTMNTVLPTMTNFILPGGNTVVSFCHIARTVCRRAERLATQLIENENFELTVLAYINRLSDYFFVLARKLAYDFRIDETKWIPENKG